MTGEDAAFRAVRNTAIALFILGGIGESHLDAKLGRLKTAYGIEVSIGAPQVAYRETLKARVEMDYTHKKRTAGFCEFARVKIDFVPIRMDAAPAFESRTAGGAVPGDYISGVEKGVASATASGLLAGFRVAGVEATLLDGAYHDTDSSVLAFEIAGREPIIRVEVATPEDFLGAIFGDLTVRRGEVRHQTASGDMVVVEAIGVPAANLFGYAKPATATEQRQGDVHDALHGLQAGP